MTSTARDGDAAVGCQDPRSDAEDGRGLASAFGVPRSYRRPLNRNVAEHGQEEPGLRIEEPADRPETSRPATRFSSDPGRSQESAVPGLGIGRNGDGGRDPSALAGARGGGGPRPGVDLSRGLPPIPGISTRNKAIKAAAHGVTSAGVTVRAGVLRLLADAQRRFHRRTAFRIRDPVAEGIRPGLPRLPSS